MKKSDMIEAIVKETRERYEKLAEARVTMARLYPDLRGQGFLKAENIIGAEPFVEHINYMWYEAVTIRNMLGIKDQFCMTDRCSALHTAFYRWAENGEDLPNNI